MLPIAGEPIENRLTLSGVLAPNRTVAAFSKVAGKLIENRVKEGDRVARDQTIALVNQDLPGQDFKDHEVKAPITGVVAKVNLDPGSLVGPGVPLAAIVDIDNLKVTVGVIEAEIGKVAVGLPADISVPAYPDRRFRGQVTNILPLVDPLSHTGKVEVMIPNPDQRLKPGMSATVSLVLGRKDEALVVPRKTIIEKMGEKYVFTYAGGIAHRRNVTTGYEEADRVEVCDGLMPGDTVITTDLNVLKDGSRVRFQAQDSAAAKPRPQEE
ncbi:MAG: efflux RND transporter periplasmic adaptor subunit [candidate division WOR-3 bacterium]